jgi:hypothetical protein
MNFIPSKLLLKLARQQINTKSASRVARLSPVSLTRRKPTMETLRMLSFRMNRVKYLPRVKYHRLRQQLSNHKDLMVCGMVSLLSRI